MRQRSFAALLARPIPQILWDRSAPIRFNDIISQGEYLTGGFRKLLKQTFRK